MSAADLIIAVVILAGASWLLYRSFRKKKGGPCGCSDCGCGKK